MRILKVSSKSGASQVAGAIAGAVREEGKVEVQAVGAGATNQAIKAIAIARGFLLETDVNLICIPSFIEIEIDGESRTAISMVVEPRKRSAYIIRFQARLSRKVGFSRGEVFSKIRKTSMPDAEKYPRVFKKNAL